MSLTEICEIIMDASYLHFHLVAILVVRANNSYCSAQEYVCNSQKRMQESVLPWKTDQR